MTFTRMVSFLCLLSLWLNVRSLFYFLQKGMGKK